MSITKSTIVCDWPNCNGSETIEWTMDGPVYGKQDQTPNWVTLNNQFGPHLCRAHANRTKVELNSLRDRLKGAVMAADAILAKIKASITPGVSKIDDNLLFGAKTSFDHMYPGCDDAWKHAVKKAVQK